MNDFAIFATTRLAGFDREHQWTAYFPSNEDRALALEILDAYAKEVAPDEGWLFHTANKVEVMREVWVEVDQDGAEMREVDIENP